MEGTFEENYSVRLVRQSHTGALLRETWSIATGAQLPGRLVGPADREFDPVTGVAVCEKWMIAGRIGRFDPGPEVVRRDRLSGHVYEEWLKRGSPHTPRVRWFNRRSGRLVAEEYLNEKYRLHRPDDQPAFIGYDRVTGEVKNEQWMRGGKHHRDGDKPAHIFRNIPTGVVIMEVYYKNGQLHRDAGPAIIFRDPRTGRLGRQEYWTAGAWEKTIRKIDAPSLT